MSTDWDRYQKCSQVCGAAAGKPCLLKTGFRAVERIEVFEEAEEPHSGRKLRAAAARAGGDR